MCQMLVQNREYAEMPSHTDALILLEKNRDEPSKEEEDTNYLNTIYTNFVFCVFNPNLFYKWLFLLFLIS